MPRTKMPDATRPAVDAGELIVLAGRPTALRGEVYVSNPGAERLRLHRRPLAFAPDAERLAFAGSTGAAPAVRITPGVLRTGHTGQVKLSAALDPHTPPGEYRAEVEIAGRTHPVIMKVIELTALRVAPSLLVVENLPDQTVKKSIVVSNLGNVPLFIGKLGAVYLDDELLICRTLRHAAASVDNELRSFEDYLARILLSAKQVAESSGILRVHSEAVVVQPGEVRTIDLQIRVPNTLDRRGRYRGVIPIYTASLAFVVVPTAGPEIPDEEPRPKPRARKSAAP